MFRKLLGFFLILCLCFGLIGCGKKKVTTKKNNTSSPTTGSESVIEESEPVEPTESSEPEEESSKPKPKPKTSSVKSTVSTTPKTVVQPAKQISVGYRYNTNTDINDNVFLDALIYTGYNITKHRNDGNMWVYILAENKRGLGYLSDITYGGGCTGYETKNGKPDLVAFKRGGLVCASYATYVYFNYLPNVAGISTGSLTKPTDPHLAHDWYMAASNWVKKGYSEFISFTASLGAANHTVFQASKSIPIGSIIIFKDFKDRNNSKANHGTHVCIYAGFKNGYHWVTHVGNKNGPEFCAIERMSCGPDPQWPLAVITTPSNIRFAAMLKVTVADENGTPVKGVSLSLKQTSTNATTSLKKTDAKGVSKKEGLKYGKYVLTVTPPKGYTIDKKTKNITLTTASNSANSVKITIKKIPEPSTPSSTSSEESQTDSQGGEE